MAIWEIVFYESASGRAPVREYIDALSTSDAARVAVGLRLLAQSGTALGMPHVRPVVGTELWELRIRGRVQHRVLYLAVSGRRMLLLHAFEKKTDETPARAIETALHRLADHRRRLEQ
jgi:phage-related protein